MQQKKHYNEQNLTADDIGLVELNEAFASQSIECIRQLELDTEKVNVNGGAIAFGHPLGASGARILTTLIYEMKRRDVKYGLATMCIGSVKELLPLSKIVRIKTPLFGFIRVRAL